MKKNILESFLDKLLSFPLWVKQIIYFRLFQNLSLSLSEDFIKLEEKDIFHLFVPQLTFLGKMELSEKKNGYDDNVYNFLASVSEGLNMLEISMNNFWTMEEVAKYYILCLEQEYIKTPESVFVHAMGSFIAGKFRTGEYFKAVGKIDIHQLEQTIIRQKEDIKIGTPHKMAEVMIGLGFITEKESHSLLVIKEEAQKRFVLDAGSVPVCLNDAAEKETEYKSQIAKLNEQNHQLKEQLRKLLAFVKKNG